MRHNSISKARTQSGIGKMSILLIVITIVLITAASAGAYFYFGQSASKHKPAASHAKKPLPEPKFVKLDPFTVNLQGANGRVLYIGISLQVATEKLAERVKAHLPQIRSRLLTELSDKKPSDLTSRKGKTQLAQSLRETIARPYSRHGKALAIQSVLFTNFILQ